MNTHKILTQLQEQPREINFADVISAIESDYNFIETRFKNGELINEEGENSDSCKIFAFALLNKLEEDKTLLLFGQYYQDVLNTPDGVDHQNIRQFIQHGFSGLHFPKAPLSPK